MSEPGIRSLESEPASADFVFLVVDPVVSIFAVEICGDLLNEVGGEGRQTCWRGFEEIRAGSHLVLSGTKWKGVSDMADIYRALSAGLGGLLAQRMLG